MTIYARNDLSGIFGIPGHPPFQPGEEREVPMDVGVWLSTRPHEFTLRYEGDDFPFRDDAGKVRRLGYFGPIDARFGYGGGGISLLRAFTHLGIEVKVNSFYNHGFTSAYPKDLPPDAACQLTSRKFIPKWEWAQCLPNDYERSNGARYRIAHTMWEMDRIPDGSNKKEKIAAAFGDWAALINRHSQRLVVPCQHNAEVFEACGVRVPIAVVPYGLDTDLWPYHQRKIRDVFTVVLYGDLTDRKGPREAVWAFQQAFVGQDDVRLILKTQGGHLGKATHTSQMPVIDDPRVVVVNETYSRAQLVRMLHEADCFLWPSRGEGFGLPPLQAALTGAPVVMTTHTGMGDYYDPRYFYPIETAGTSPAPLYGNWYEPDVDSAAEQLRKVYENRATALKKGKAAAAYVRKNFSLEAFAERIAAYLDTLE